MRKTKIICTIGPASETKKVLIDMCKAGMNVARLNFSHGTHEEHKQAMERVRRISDEIDIPVAILLDTKGPEIRTGLVENDGKITISAGEKVEIVTDDSFCTASSSGKNCRISVFCRL